MKILVITNLFPNPTEPTRGIFTEQILSPIKRKNDVDVLTPVPWFPKNIVFNSIKKWKKYKEIPSEYIWNNQEVKSIRYFYIPKIGGPAHALLMSIFLKKAISKLHKENNYDCINARWVYPDGVATILATMTLKIPTVITAQGCDINQYSYLATRKFQIAWALKRSSAVIAVSKSLRNRIANLGIDPKRINVISNGVNSNRFTIRNKELARDQLNLLPLYKYILFVGSLEYVKGIDVLLKSVVLLKNSITNFKVIIIGEGKLKSYIERNVVENHLTDYLTMYGSVSHKDIGLYMSASDVLCLPSIREGHPNVINEALSSGRPVVATAVGSVPDLINEKCGIIVAPNNEKLLSEALKISLDISWDENIIRSQMEGKSWDDCSRKYSKVLESVIHDQNSI